MRSAENAQTLTAIPPEQVGWLRRTLTEGNIQSYRILRRSVRNVCGEECEHTCSRLNVVECDVSDFNELLFGTTGTS